MGGLGAADSALIKTWRAPEERHGSPGAIRATMGGLGAATPRSKNLACSRGAPRVPRGDPSHHGGFGGPFRGPPIQQSQLPGVLPGVQQDLIGGISVAIETEGGRVRRQGSLDNVISQEIGGAAGGHETVARQRTDHVGTLHRKGPDEDNGSLAFSRSSRHRPRTGEAARSRRRGPESFVTSRAGRSPGTRGRTREAAPVPLVHMIVPEHEHGRAISAPLGAPVRSSGKHSSSRCR